MKNIYEMLNDIEINLDEYEKEDFNDIEKQKIKKNFKKSIRKNNNRKYVAVASVAIITIGVFSNYNIRTYAFEKIEDISYSIKNALGIDNDLSGYLENINQSVTKKGLTVKVKDALLEDDELLIYIEHEYDKELKEGEYIDLISERLYINGERINKGSSGYYTKRSGNKSEFVVGYRLDKNKYNGDIKVKLKINDAYKWESEDRDEYKQIIGPWTFKFIVNGDNLKKNTKNIVLNKEIKLDNGESIYIKEYKENLISKEIDVKMRDNERYIIFKGKDNLGNDIEFNIKGGIYNVGESTYELIKNNLDIDDKVTSYKLIPYAKNENLKDGKVQNEFIKIGDEFTINLK